MLNSKKSKSVVLQSADVRIALPLPLGLAGDLMEIIGTRYPNTTIVTDSGHSGELVFRVPNPDYPGGPLPEKVGSADDLFDPEEGTLMGIDENGFDIAGDEHIVDMLIKWAKTMFFEFPEENFLEISVTEKHSGQEYTIVVVKPSLTETAHADAVNEARCVDVRAKAVADALSVVTGIRQGLGPDASPDVLAALNAVADRIEGI